MFKYQFEIDEDIDSKAFVQKMYNFTILYYNIKRVEKEEKIEIEKQSKMIEEDIEEEESTNKEEESTDKKEESTDKKEEKKLKKVIKSYYTLRLYPQAACKIKKDVLPEDKLIFQVEKEKLRNIMIKQQQEAFKGNKGTFSRQYASKKGVFVKLICYRVDRVEEIEITDLI